MAKTTMTANNNEHGESRRDFLQLTAAAFGAVGVGTLAWPSLIR